MKNELDSSKTEPKLYPKMRRRDPSKMFRYLASIVAKHCDNETKVSIIISHVLNEYGINSLSEKYNNKLSSGHEKGGEGDGFVCNAK